ncbi:hypothetical protein [uncultured Thiodictyon sp.]|uniref:hypothetical protein n=1 Tax=uncultured Thiodictyon sp. TaxID=1846217 RepID=UPI0025FB8AFF|nr:hypothetical protein [uncultured Thiodictyon sp.]
MRTEEKVIAALRWLPPGKQAEVLDFTDFLRGQQAVTAERGSDGRVAPELSWCPHAPELTCDG